MNPTNIVKSILKKPNAKDIDPFAFSNKSEHSIALETFISHLRARFIFREVEEVTITAPEECDTLFHTSPFHSSVTHPNDVFNDADLTHRVTIHTNQYSVLTGRSSREKDTLEGAMFVLSPETRCELDPITMEYTNPNHYRDVCPPLPQCGDMIALCPEDDELLLHGMLTYGIDVEDTIAHPFKVKAWFVCSYQFYRFVTLFTHGPHHTYHKAFQSGKLRERLMSGSQLSTNSYLKTYRSHVDNNIPFDFDAEENIDSYIAMRSEGCSIDHVHIYPAIVTMMYFGFLPTIYNMPINRDQDGKRVLLNMHDWHLPYSFVQLFLQRWRPFIVEKTFITKSKRSPKKTFPQKKVFAPQPQRKLINITSTKAFPPLRK